MKKLVLILLSALSLTAFAQEPNWYNDSQRAANYPTSKFFSGISYGTIQRGEDEGKAKSRVADAARLEAIKTIRVQVQNETTMSTQSESIETLDGWAESVRESLDSKTTTKVDLEIPGLQTESWRIPGTNDVAGFAYIKKATLSRQMDKQVTAGLTRIETILDNADQQISQGQKTQAREAIKKAIPLFQEVEQAQRILIAADPLSDAESLQLDETKKLQQRYMRMFSELKNGINIYLACDAKIFGANYPTLKSEIQGNLSKMGCTFVNSAAQADWAIYVTAQARELNKTDFGSMSTYFVYVDANIAVEKTATGQRIYENEISEKGGHTQNFEKASREAYKTISPRISEIINEQIKQ